MNENKTAAPKTAESSPDFNQRLDQKIHDLRRQLDRFRSETEQRDNKLRQEMSALGAMFDKKKAGSSVFCVRSETPDKRSLQACFLTNSHDK